MMPSIRSARAIRPLLSSPLVVRPSIRDFRNGLGFVGKRQVVLCTSFGAFDDSRKRYIELDLSRPYTSVDDLRADVEVFAVYPNAPRPEEHLDETAQIIRALARKSEPRRTARFDANAIPEAAAGD